MYIFALRCNVRSTYQNMDILRLAEHSQLVLNDHYSELSMWRNFFSNVRKQKFHFILLNVANFIRIVWTQVISQVFFLSFLLLFPCDAWNEMRFGLQRALSIIPIQIFYATPKSAIGKWFRERIKAVDNNRIKFSVFSTSVSSEFGFFFPACVRTESVRLLCYWCFILRSE